MGYRASDALRSVIVAAAAIAQPAAAFGPFRGGPGSEGAAARLGGGDAPLEPAGYAFLIWLLIFLGSLAFAVVHALPANARTPAFRQAGWAAVVTFGACIAYLALSRHGPYWATTPVIAVQLAGALIALYALRRTGEGSGAAFAAAVFGVYAGWLSIAFFVSPQAVAAAYSVDPVGLTSALGAMVLLGAAGLFACIAATRARFPLAYLFGAGWAIAAVIIGQLERDGPPEIVAVAAGAGVLLALATVIGRLRQPRAV